MTKKKSRPRKYRSDLSAAIHDMAGGLHRIGVIDQATMREFDASCLTPVAPLSAKANRGHPQAGGCQPGCLRALPERETKARQRVGTRREKSRAARPSSSLRL